MLQSGLSFGEESAEPMPASINAASCLGVPSRGSRIPQQFNTSYQNTFVLDTFLNRPCHSPGPSTRPARLCQLQRAAQPSTLAHSTALPLTATLRSEQLPGAVLGLRDTPPKARRWPDRERHVWCPGSQEED